LVYSQFLGIDRPAKAWVIFSGILVVRVVLGIIDVLFRTINAQTLLGNLKFALDMSVGGSDRSL
jgi:hypothetical protein